jgi:uncharacterized coiled-coil protein SlyX
LLTLFIRYRKNLEELMTDEEKLAKKKQETEARIVAINEDVKKGNDTLLEIRESLATSDIFKRNIDDNIRYLVSRLAESELQRANSAYYGDVTRTDTGNRRPTWRS